MRHLHSPRQETIRLVGFAEVIAGLVLVLIWVQLRDPLHLVLALALVIGGIASWLSTRQGSTAGGPGDDEGPDPLSALVSLDRSSLPGEAEDDHRVELGPDEIPTLETLVGWIDEQDYLPATQAAPRASWLLRLARRRAVVFDAGGEAHYLLPAGTPLAAGDRVTVQWRSRG